jgi:hypothetical protein
MSDEDLFKLVFDLRYDPVIVPTDIEHAMGRNVIGAGEARLQIRKTLPLSPHRQLVPCFEWRFGGRVLVPEFLKPAARNHMHTRYSHNVNMFHKRKCSHNVNTANR